MTEQLDLATIKNVVFLYAKIAEPVLTKDAKDRGVKPDPKDPYHETEWTLQAAVPEKIFKALKRKFKGASNFKNAKEYTVEEFNAQFFADGKNQPDFGDATDVAVIKFSQKCRNGKGKDQTQPAVIGIKGKVQDHNGLTVNADVLLGNGTLGHLQLRPVNFDTYGIYLYPQALCITHLVEYHGASPAAVDYAAFDMEELDDVELDAKEKEEDDDFDSDIPF